MQPADGWDKRVCLTRAGRRIRGGFRTWFRLPARWRIIALAAALVALTAVGIAIAWQGSDPPAEPTNLLVNRVTEVQVGARSSPGERITGVTFTFPPNADVSAVSAASVTLTHGGASVTPTGVTVNVANRTVTITLSSARTGSEANRIFVARVRDVAHPSEPGSYTYHVSLTSDQGTISGTSPAYTLAANTSAPSVGAVSLGSAYADSISSYAFPVTVGQFGRLAATAAPGGTVTPNSITVEFPVGTVLPASAAASSVTVNGTPLATAPSISGQRVTVRIPADVTIPASGVADLVFTSA
ncbi:MAG TPA: hypothetical protein VFH17_06520, partial [Coriobacteriia bacterium]|nr:hypothetical protein [Coriobacteriia bacterium]